MTIGDRVLIRRDISGGRVQLMSRTVYDSGVVVVLTRTEAMVKLDDGSIVKRPKRTVFVDPLHH